MNKLTKHQLLERDAERYRLLRLYNVSASFVESKSRPLPCATLAFFGTYVGLPYSEDVLDHQVDRMLGYEKSMNFHTDAILENIQRRVRKNVADLTEDRNNDY